MAQTVLSKEQILNFLSNFFPYEINFRLASYRLRNKTITYWRYAIDSRFLNDSEYSASLCHHTFQIVAYRHL